MGFVERLKTLMDRREVSGYRLAKDIDVNNSTIRSWLKGRAEYPRGENLKKLSKYFGVHPAWLLYGEEQYTPNLESEAQKLAEEIASYGDQGIRKARQFLKILEEDKALDIRPLRRYKKAG